MRLDANAIQKCSGYQFSEEPLSERCAVKNFLSTIRSDRSRALKLQRSPVLSCDEQATDVTTTVHFHRFEKAEPKLLCIHFFGHSIVFLMCHPWHA